MPESSPTNGRFDLLAQKYLESRLNSQEAAELHQWIKAHPESGHELLDQLRVHELMKEAARAEHVTPMQAPSAPAASRRRTWIATAALIAFGSLVFLMSRQERPQPVIGAEPQLGEPRSMAMAVLGAQSDAQWHSEAPSLQSPLSPGVLRLREGVARIDFFNGAQVVISGPCDFELLSSNRAYCHSGRVTAEVPPQARGFVIETPAGAIHDLGTSFGLMVQGDQADLHVFDGEVELEDDRTERFLSGQGARLVAGRPTMRFKASQDGFTLPGEIGRLRDDALMRPQEIWRTAGERWNHDSDLLARFTFDKLEGGGFRLPNQAVSGAVSYGALVGCSLSKGRWPDQAALQFRNLSDRVRVVVPSELSSATLTAWVEVHSLSNLYNSLLMSDGFDAGAMHWQILSDGRLRLGINHQAKYMSNYDSPKIINSEMFGSWIHLATVVDSDAKKVLHYLNGKLIAEVDGHRFHSLRIGAACIGNWSDPIDSTPIRNFNGLMGEMTIHRRALNEEEIQEFHDLGSPHRNSGAE